MVPFAGDTFSFPGVVAFWAQPAAKTTAATKRISVMAFQIPFINIPRKFSSFTLK
jgi:hypothetical protein